MTLRNSFIRTYRALDGRLFSRLPMRWQKSAAGAALRVARTLFPRYAWPTSVDPLLVRRLPRALPASRRKLPDWARQDMDGLARSVDPLLSPDKFAATNPDVYAPPIHWQEAGTVYGHLRSRLGQGDYDTVFLVPWLKRGGADLGALHHIRACHEAFGHRTLVIATEPHDSPWASRLPAGVRFLEAGPELTGLSVPHAEQEIVLARLLIQLAPRRIHLIGSHLGWRTVVRHGLAIHQASRLYASLYCDDRDGHGYRDGLAVRYLADAAPCLDAVITDNSVSPEEWRRNLGVSDDLFHVVHFPAPAMLAAGISHPGRRLLWASRLDRQKRPDLLARLVAALPDYHWDIYGAQVVPGHGGDVGTLRKAGNVSLHGGYDDFAHIVRPDHAAFVYTSAWDGLPNVLLEATSAHLPIVAPDIGGIRDLIPPQRLIRPTDDVAQYAHAIRALDDAATRTAWLRAQQEHLAGFTPENFLAGLRRIPGYAS
jgi:glycosyltransferase involved in cell wall biosynthesis